jgi:hypothetical protein
MYHKQDSSTQQQWVYSGDKRDRHGPVSRWLPLAGNRGWRTNTAIDPRVESSDAIISDTRLYFYSLHYCTGGRLVLMFVRIRIGWRVRVRVG